MSSDEAKAPEPDGLLALLLRGYAFLAESTVRRSAAYLRDFGDLVREGSVEPRLWVGSAERMWSGLAEDYADYLRLLTPPTDAAAQDGASAAPIPTVCVSVPEPRGVQTVQEVAFDMPPAVFERARATTLLLDVPDFWLGRRRVLMRDRHFMLDPARVSKGEPRCKVRLFDLPPGLLCGMTLSGPVNVTATENGIPASPLTVFVVEVKVT